jgi:RNA polymerase sigma factor (sigma-70 family)
MCVDGSPTDEEHPRPHETGFLPDSSGSPSDPGPLAEDAFVRSETQHLRRIARELLPSVGERDDLVQDVWLAALEHPPRERSRLSSWLRVVTKHAARRLWRSSRSRESGERSVARSESQPPSSTRSSGGRTRRAAAMDRRAPAALSGSPPTPFFEGASQNEIARRLSRPRPTVRSQLKRGLERLRARHVGRPDPRRDRLTAVWLLWLAFLAQSPARTVRTTTIAAGRSSGLAALQESSVSRSADSLRPRTPDRARRRARANPRARSRRDVTAPRAASTVTTMCVDGSPTDEPGGDSPPVREPDAAAHSSGSTPPPEPLAEDAFVRSETKRLAASRRSSSRTRTRATIWSRTSGSRRSSTRRASAAVCPPGSES